MQYNFDEYADRVIQRYKLKKKNETEFGEQPCPHCGGTDRFWISNFNGELKHHCRQNCDPLERLKAMKKDGALPEFYYDTEPLYFHKKRIPLLGAFRQYSKTVVRLVNVKTKKFAGHQTILPLGKKIFTKGLVKEGAGAFIGDPSEKLYVCEGWATAVTVHISTGEQALFALDAKTLPKTVKLLKHPNIVIAADNDAEGIEAARATGLPWAAPKRNGDDWWDVFDRDGKEAVRKGLSAALLHQTAQDQLAVNVKTQAPQTVSAKDLALKNFPPMKFPVDGILPEVGLAIGSGAPKIGKSYFCFNLIKQMPDDRPVIYLGLEDNEQRLQRRVFEIFGNNIPKNLKLLAGLKEGTEIPKGKEALEWLRKLCAKDRQPQCVFIDTVANILPDHKHTDYAETTREWGNLRKLAHELKTVLYAVHHNRKASDTDFDPLENILGSQGIAGTVETAHVLQKVPNSSNVKVHFTGKDIEKQDVVYKWENPGFSILGDETTSRLGTVQEAALNIIKQHPRCQNRLIEDKLSKTKGEVSRAVGRLAELRLVQKVNSRLIATPVNPVNSANLYNDEQL